MLLFKMWTSFRGVQPLNIIQIYWSSSHQTGKIIVLGDYISINVHEFTIQLLSGKLPMTKPASNRIKWRPRVFFSAQLAFHCPPPTHHRCARRPPGTPQHRIAFWFLFSAGTIETWVLKLETTVPHDIRSVCKSPINRHDNDP